MKKQFLVLCLFLFSCYSFSFSQSYITAGGVRLGKYMGLTVSQRVLPKLTVEGMYQRNLDGSNQYLTGLVKRHHNLLVKNFNFYYGGGAHIGFTNQNTETTNSFTGVDGIFGVEMSIARFNISLDYKPTINIGQNNWYESQGGISVRYILIKGNSPQAKKRQKARNYRDRQKNKALNYRKRSLKREEKGKW